MSMLEVKDLQVYYGVIQALKGISFRVEKGEVIALYPLMPNRMTVDRDSSGRLYYKYYPADSDRNYSGKSRKHCF